MIHNLDEDIISWPVVLDFRLGGSDRVVIEERENTYVLRVQQGEKLVAVDHQNLADEGCDELHAALKAAHFHIERLCYEAIFEQDK